ncbi:MAG: flagellar hook-associated protein FlgL [Lachnospiraceae bacterium]|nr:flagellar hook-associated protein FlgL [Lachnospiraceae bacterium]
MRVTNNMMRSNSLMNMQKNKNVYNKYLQQYNTQKKIQRPSDDPTVAVRELKFRTELAEISQYKSNIEDALSWMNETETVLGQIADRLDDIEYYCTQAATGTYDAKQRADIVAQLKEYAEYIYEQCANHDYAGRYIFTGHRTDVPLLFKEAQSNITYTITENLDINSIIKYDYVYGEASYDDAKSAEDYANEASLFQTTHRILLSYDNCDKDGQDVTLTYTDAQGNTKTVTAITKSVSDDATYNEHLHPGENEVYYVPETGEIVFGDAVYDDIRAGSGLSVIYQKTEFSKNDIRPEHYFVCSTLDNSTGETAKYTNAGKQNINYQVNFNQTLTVNTEACNAISMSTGRAIEDIINRCNDIDVIEQKLAEVKKRISDCDEGDTETLDNLNELKSQIETQLALEKTVLTNAFGSTITICQKEITNLGVAEADHGSRYARLEMTQKRLEEQEIDTEEAQSDNMDADLGEAYIQFNEANLLYQAILNATSQILGQSLLDFI